MRCDQDTYLSRKIVSIMPPWAPFRLVVCVVVIARVYPSSSVPVYTRALQSPVAFPQLSSQAPTNLQWLTSSAVYRQPPISIPFMQQALPQQTMPLITAPAPCAPPPCATPSPCPCNPCKKCKCKNKCKCDPCCCTAEDERIQVLGQFLERASDYYFDPILDEPCEKPKPCCGCKRPRSSSCCCGKEDDYDDFDCQEEDQQRPPPRRNRRPGGSRGNNSSPGRSGGGGGGGGGGGRNADAGRALDEGDDFMPRDRSSSGKRRKDRRCGCSRDRGCSCGKPVCCCEPEPYDCCY